MSPTSGSAVLLCFLVLCTYSCYAAHIVSFAYIGATSHTMVMAKVGQELVSRGHNVTLIVSEIDVGKGNTTGLTVFTHKSETKSSQEFKNKFKEIAKQAPIESIVSIVSLQAKDCEVMINDVELSTYLASRPIDLVVGDAAYACGRLYTNMLNLPHVDISPVGFFDPALTQPYGIPVPLNSVPMMGTRMTNDMNFAQRLKNFIMYFIHRGVGKFLLAPIFNDLRVKYDVTPRDGAESLALAQMLLVPTTFGLEFTRSLPPNVRMVGPILPEPARPLSAELEAWMQQPGDVLLGSLGSLSSLSDEVHAKILTAFGALPGVRVLWKFNGQLPVGVSVPPNVRVDSGWIPQNDVLGHAKTVAFFSHGGMNGIQEAAYHGVPVVGFPTFGDQWENVQRTVGAGMGVEVDKDAFTAQSLAADIQRVLSQPSFRDNAQRVARLTREHGGAVEVGEWVDYVLAHGAEHLRPLRALQQPWYEQWLLDVMLFICSVLSLVAWMLYKLFACVLGLCFGKKKSKTD